MRTLGRRSTRGRSQSNRIVEAAVTLLVLGGALTIAPMFMGASLFGKVLASVRPIGMVMLAIGAAGLWLGTRQKSNEESVRSTVRPTRSEPNLAHRAEIIDLPLRASPAPAAAPQAPTVWGREVFEAIEWRRFEAVVERLFAQAGFETRSQSHGADGGVDVWLHSRHKAGQPVSVVQCKHWQGKRVGVDKIRELRGVMAAHDVKRGQFATTSSFTPDAESFARENGINLLDVDRLLDLIGKRTPEQQSELLAVALEGEYWRPTCVNCGTKMIERGPRSGGQVFWGCPGFPRCRTTMPMRVR